MKLTKRILSIVVIAQLVLAFNLLHAQEYQGYSSAEIARLNTAKSADYLTDDEKEVVLVLNMIRSNGAKFWDKMAEPYIAKHDEIKPSRYTSSLERDLRNAPNLPILSPNKTLHKVANKHAVASGREGLLGHKSPAGTFEQRLKPLTRDFNYLLENCDYGSSKAMDIIMNLMIDEGIPDVGHRKNILHEQIDAAGIAIAPHKTYSHTCVQVFGKLRE